MSSSTPRVQNLRARRAEAGLTHFRMRGMSHEWEEMEQLRAANEATQEAMTRNENFVPPEVALEKHPPTIPVLRSVLREAYLRRVTHINLMRTALCQ